MTVDITEAIWTIATLAGLAVAIANLAEAVHDLRAVERLAGHDATLRAVAAGAVRNESRHTACLALLVLLGIVAMLTPPATSEHPSQALAAAVAMFMVAITLIAGGVDDRLTRRRLMRRTEDRNDA